MKKSIILLLISSLFLAGCESYLDRQPDDMLTSDTIWEKQSTAVAYLWNVYSFMYEESYLAGQFVQQYMSDEAAGSFPQTWTKYFNTNTYNPGNACAGDIYTRPYQGIYEASIFIENIHKCPELSEVEIKSYRAEARFLRACYYFMLMRFYGPVFFNGYTSYEALEANLYTVDRAPWQTLVDFVTSELDEAYKDLREDYELTKEYGRVTKGAALAVKEMMLLYSARPLFNGQNGTHIYDNIKNNKGEQLFNITYDENRWKLAADAARDMIDYAEAGHYELMNSSTNPDPLHRGLENLHKLFVEDHAPKEYILTTQKVGQHFRQSTFPQNIVAQVDGWASLSPTYKLVDAFAMANGVYPVTTEHWNSEAYALGKNVDDENPAQVDPRAVEAGYSETGSVKMKNPLLAAVAINQEQFPVLEKDTPNRLAGREARFYRNIAWSGMQFMAGDAKIESDIEFYYNGKNGIANANNVPPCGFLALKLYDPTLNVKTTGWGTYSWPKIRLAGVYLDYIEALNEYDPTNADILKYWNKIRNRAGVPNIEEVYPDIVGDKELQREYIRRERMVELCFENHRFNDCRMWMISEKTSNGYTIGCNQKAPNDDIDGDYWLRCEIGMDQYAFGEHKQMGPRVFKQRSYLLPFPTSEVNKVPALRNSQNLGW